MYRICKQFSFDAAHQLTGLPNGHKCRRLHGHTYRVEVVIASDTLDDNGFVVDFGDLASFGTYVKEVFDHRFLNDVLDVAPTSENLAAHFCHWCARNLGLPSQVRIAAVRVSETPSTWAEFTPEVSDD